MHDLIHNACSSKHTPAMNKLNTARRAQIIACEGMSVRARRSNDTARS